MLLVKTNSIQNVFDISITQINNLYTKLNIPLIIKACVLHIILARSVSNRIRFSISWVALSSLPNKSVNTLTIVFLYMSNTLKKTV